MSNYVKPTERLRRRPIAAFTLAELLITVGVLVLLMLLFTQLLNSAATVTTLGHKRMDADSQARELFDRMAIDVAQMVKRSDVDYYLKSSGTAADCGVCGTQAGNDRFAFYSAVTGYYHSSPAPTPSYTGRGSISLISYRINADNSSSSYNRMERMGKGLAWNGLSSSWTPVVFLPGTIGGPSPSPSGNWPAAVSASVSDSSYEVIGPQVFRFEYYYLLKNGITSAIPWYTSSTVNAMRDVAAIIADIAVIDPKSKVLLDNNQVATLAGSLSDFSGQAPGVLLSNWRTTIDGTPNLPRPALSSIRLYERYLYLSPPNLGTP